MAEKKKRFTFADAKQKIKDLEAKIESLNVDLSDNIVTEGELKVLKIYKVGFFIAAPLAVVKIIDLVSTLF